MTRRLRALAWALACGAASAAAQDGASPPQAFADAQADAQADAEAHALRLADDTPTPVAAPRAWRAALEWAEGGERGRPGGAGAAVRRLSLDLRGEPVRPDGWRAAFAPRLDIEQPAQPASGDAAVLTLREAWAGLQLPAGTLLDAGRVRVRTGVALGYHPTDLFREGSARVRSAIDPASQRHQAQGSVMLRGQQVWDGGAAALMLSPRLRGNDEGRGIALDLGATNPRDRALATWSPALSRRVSTQAVAAWQAGRSPLWGLNTTWLAGDATVVHLEAAAGRMPSHLGLALQRPGDARWRGQFALGLTHTTPGRLSLTAELQHDGAALDSAAWDRLRQGPLPDCLRYLDTVQRQQALATRHAALLHATWTDAFVPRLQLAALVAADTAGARRAGWFEARYHADERLDLALQWQRVDSRPAPAPAPPLGARRWLASVTAFF